MNITLECQVRPKDTKPRALRRQGQIPGVLYGHQGVESVSLVITQDKVNKLLREASLNNTLVDLNVTDLPWNGRVLIKEVQTHPWKPQVHHVSFFSVSVGDRLNITVPVHFVGNPTGLKNGGILEQLVTEVQVQCISSNIPEALEIDITNLEVGQSLCVKDLPASEGVEIMDDPDKLVVSVLSPSKPEESPSQE